MESIFFNTPTIRHKTTDIYSSNNQYIKKVDISNGILFFDISLKNQTKSIELNNLDRMIMMCVVKKGSLSIGDSVLKQNSVSIYATSRQNFSLTINSEKESEIFILFIADFFLKQYLSFNADEPIDFLYNIIQDEVVLEQISKQPIDALSLFIIDKILEQKMDSSMHSIRSMHYILELIIHRFELLDMVDKRIEKDELEIAKKAKNFLLKSFINPPTIETLSHLCATNESKLKKVFKRVYKTTIYGYVQKLRLEEANILLREEMLTIGEIAKRVGYKHQGHFSKLFFKTYGVYPKDLLKH
jgi:AraC-like DNA-binding protein